MDENRDIIKKFPHRCKILRLDLLAIFLKYKGKENFMPDLLIEMKNKFGNITDSDVICISEYFEIEENKIRKVADENEQLEIIPVEQHIIKVCLGTSCKNAGSEKILEKISETLEVSVGDCTKDGKFCLQPVECLGLCEIAPVIGVDDVFYGNVDGCDVLKLIMHEKQKAED